MGRMSVDHGQSRGVFIYSTVHRELAGGEIVGRAWVVDRGLDEVGTREAPEHAATSGDYQTVAHSRAHVASMRGGQAADEEVPTYTLKLW